LEADIRGHIRLEHEMKIHMDYLEAKVEKFEKEQKQLEEEKKQTAKKISQLQEKINLFKTDRDDQAKQTKKLKIRLDEMKKIS
jgi:peptidoglycan hydrolase CwlO-like protein